MVTLHKNYAKMDGGDRPSQIPVINQDQIGQIEDDMTTIETEFNNNQTAMSDKADLVNGKVKDEQIPDWCHDHTSSTDNPHQVTAAQVGKDEAQWNADKIQNIPVDTTNIQGSQYLAYNPAYNRFQPASPGTPAAHAASHQDGGTDEIDITGLSGIPVDLDIHAKTAKVPADNDEIGILDSENHFVQKKMTWGSLKDNVFKDNAQNEYRASATISARQPFEGNSTWAKVNFDTVVSDPNGNFDSATTHSYTVPKDGIYLASAYVSLNIAPLSADSHSTIGVFRNDTLVEASFDYLPSMADTVTSKTVQISVTDSFEAGDVITVKVRASNNAGKNIECMEGADITRFSMQYLGQLSEQLSTVNLPITSSAVTTDGTIFAGTTDGIYRSTDEQNWTKLRSFSADYFRCVFVDNNDNLYISAKTANANDSGLWRSSDGGTTFTRVITLAAGEHIWGIDQDSNGNIYAGVYTLEETANAKVYKGTNNGQTWTVVYGGGSYRHVHGVTVNKSNNYVYLLMGDNIATDNILRSTDGGATWNLVLNALPQMTACHAESSFRLFGTDKSGIGYIYRTTNDTTTTITLSSHYQNCFFIRKNEQTGNIYAGFKLDPSATKANSNFRAVLYRSKDNGLTWQEVHVLERMSAGDGFWFASNFHNNKLYISNTKGVIFQDGFVIEDK
jgi:hypothetical protein